MADSQKDNTAVIVSVAAIVGLVILNIFAQEVPESVNFGLIGAALGASLDDIRNSIRKK